MENDEASRTANGIRQTFEYDKKGQLLAVKDADGNAVERYAYDRAGNMVRKTLAGRTTTFTFDGANQLVSSTIDGITTRYEYDAAGRMTREGDRTYTYGYLDKVMSVRDGNKAYTYTYHPDGQLASADYGASSESFTWDGLALIQRGDEQFVNEPHVGGGNPVASSKGTTYFNDMLGTTVGAKSGKQYSAATLSAFGEELNHHCPPPPTFSTSSSFFTGKPQVAGLGHAFLMRNYRAGLGKWQTADPLGYPENAPKKLRFGGKPRAQRSARRARKGPRWNQLAYCGNGVTGAVDLWGCAKVTATVKQTETPLLSGDIGTSNYTYTINLNCALHSIEFVFTELVYVDPNMKHSCDYDSGDTAIYIEHNGSPSDSSLTPVYEAVLAHEMGHANCRVECIKGYLQTSLVKLEIEWLLHADWTEADVKSKIFAQVEIAKANSITRTINAANQPTVSWFQSSSDWIFVDSGITKVNGKETTYWKWRKE